MSFWTDDRVRVLKKLWVDEGLSASAIAERLGCERSAVAGKVYRLGLSGQGGSQPARGGRSKKRLKAKPALAVVAPVSVPLGPPDAEPVPTSAGGPSLGRGLTADQRAVQERKDNAAREALAVRQGIARADQARAPGVLLSEARDQHCRWPVAGACETLTVCGAPRQGKGSYCAAHAARSVTPGSSPAKAEHALVWYADKCGRTRAPDQAAGVRHSGGKWQS